MHAQTHGQRHRLLRVTGKAPAKLGPAAIVWLLGLSQIIGYGTLYYSWPVPWLYGSFSLALLAGGLAAPFIGKRIDQHGGGATMALGSGLSAATLAAAALAPGPLTYTAALIAMQGAASFVLYDAAFATLVQATGADARQRITHLTLIAGFASTIFWPLTSWLHGLFGWREIMLGFAGLNILVCLPIHLIMANQHRSASPARQPAAATPPLSALQRRLLWLATGGFALAGFTLSAVLTQMVPLLNAVGLGASALLVSALFGPSQVLVRFVNMLIGSRRHPIAATLIALGLMPVAILVLLFTAPAVAGAFAFTLLLGFSSGLKSIVQGTLPLALFGSASYGVRLGWMALVRQIFAAAAPFALAALIEYAGPARALLVLAATASLGLAALCEVARLHRRMP